MPVVPRGVTITFHAEEFTVDAFVAARSNQAYVTFLNENSDEITIVGPPDDVRRMLIAAIDQLAMEVVQ